MLIDPTRMTIDDLLGMALEAASLASMTDTTTDTITMTTTTTTVPAGATRTTTTMGDRPFPFRCNNQLIGDSLGMRREERGAILEDATT